MTRICIIGAGARGGYLGPRLALTGRATVPAVARGATPDALRHHGWRLRLGGDTLQAPAIARDDPATLGPQDLVILAVKGPALAHIARQMAPLLHASTVILPAMNGVPWWFAQGVPGLPDSPLDSVDPGGVISRAIPLRQVVGAVLHMGVAVLEPGLAWHRMGHGIILGEPGGGSSVRLTHVAGLLQAAGMDVTLSNHVRRDIWYKLWGNLTMNPVSALTGATVDRILADPLVRHFCSVAMEEAARIGQRIDCPIDQPPEERHALTARLGAFKTSMLQDAEAGRMLELDSIVGAVRELGQRLGEPTPAIDALLGLTRLFGRVHGLYPEPHVAPEHLT